MNNDLYLTEELQKEAFTRLSRDTNTWPAEIMDVLHSVHPYISDYDLSISVKQADSDSGHGIGSVAINNKISVPIIVKQGRLMPLDLMIANDSVMPMTRMSLEQILFADAQLGEPEKPQGGSVSDMSIAHQTLPPFDGKYAYASLEIDKDNLAKALGSVSRTTLNNGLVLNESFKTVLEKFAAAAVDSAPVPVDESVVVAKHASVLDGYTQNASRTGAFEVLTADGPMTAIVTDKVTHFGTLSSPAPIARIGISMAVGHDKYAATSKPLLCKPLKDAEGLAKIAGTLPATADKMKGRGAFMKIATDTVIMTEPVTFEWQEGAQMVMRTDYGRRIKLVKVAHEDLRSDQADRITYAYGKYAVPSDWVFVPLTHRVDPVVTAVEKVAGSTVKVAAIDAAKCRLSHGTQQSVMYVDDFYNALCKMAERDIADSVIKDLHKRGESSFTVSSNTLLGEIDKLAKVQLRIPQITDEQRAAFVGFAALYDKTACEIAERITLKDGNFVIKEAAKSKEVSAEQKTIDAVLGLNFINDTNLQVFLDNIPVLEDARHIAARLLISARLGLQIDSGPIRTALFSLDEIIRDLKELRNVLTA